MNKLEAKTVYSFPMPNGVTITAACIAQLEESENSEGNITTKLFLCYGQNRLFTWREVYVGEEIIASKYVGAVVNYAILPEYDNAMKTFE